VEDILTGKGGESQYFAKPTRATHVSKRGPRTYHEEVQKGDRGGSDAPQHLFTEALYRLNCRPERRPVAVRGHADALVLPTLPAKRSHERGRHSYRVGRHPDGLPSVRPQLL
jgi:hypothetical protein